MKRRSGELRPRWSGNFAPPVFPFAPASQVCIRRIQHFRLGLSRSPLEQCPDEIVSETGERLEELGVVYGGSRAVKGCGH